jgi:predicted TIM-barrel fold metal-dependent hydrolase
MIIDAHCHVWTWEILSDHYWNQLSRLVVEFFRKNKLGEISPDQAKETILAGLMDPDGSKLIARMDEAGIDMTFILALDWGYGIGEARKSVDEINRFYGSIAKTFPDRIVAFAGIDPRRPGAVEILDRAVTDYGCRGLKYHPTSGFYPDGEESYPVLAKAQELGIPLICHLGPISSPLKSKYGQPIFLDTVVSDFPDLTVVGAHLGFCWWQELVALMAAKETTFYADLSGWQGQARRNFGKFCRILRDALDEATAEKFLWGTDNPILEGVISARQWLQIFRDLLNDAPDGLTFSGEEIGALLGGNAAKIVAALP